MPGVLSLTVTTPFGRNGIALTLAMSKSKLCLPNASHFFVVPGQSAADLQEIINIHWITEHSSYYQFCVAPQPNCYIIEGQIPPYTSYPLRGYQ
jgi:hypothetical protein